MATKYWEPKAAAVAQVSTVQVTAYDVATTYTLSVNGVVIASVIAEGSVNATATALQVAWEASTHVYATPVTATVATDTVTLTADTAEIPFTVTPAVSDGTGTLGAFTTSTAPTGPHTLNAAENWDGEALPANDDILVFRQGDGNVVWGLDQLSTTGHILNVEQSYTGLIGLEPSLFATSADGATTTDAAHEYRPRYVTLDCAAINIGRHDGPGNPGGSRRIMIDNDRASASQTNVIRTSPAGQVAGRPSVMLKFAHASADLDIRSGLVGIGVGVPGETVTVGDVLVGSADVQIGAGVTITNYSQRGGTSVLNVEVATLTACTVHGGDLTIYGDQAITTLEVRGGAVMPLSSGTITTVNHYGGTVDYTTSQEARTVTTHKLFPGRGARVAFDPGVLTITNNITTESTLVEVSIA